MYFCVLVQDFFICGALSLSSPAPPLPFLEVQKLLTSNYYSRTRSGVLGGGIRSPLPLSSFSSSAQISWPTSLLQCLPCYLDLQLPSRLLLLAWQMPLAAFLFNYKGFIHGLLFSLWRDHFLLISMTGFSPT